MTAPSSNEQPGKKTAVPEKSELATKEKAGEPLPENFEKAEENAINKVKDLFAARISAGSSNLDQRALSRMEAVEQRQIAAIKSFFHVKREQYQKKTGQSSQEREKIAEQLITEASSEAHRYSAGIEAILNRYVKNVNITTEEADDVEKALLGIEKIAKENPKLQSVAERLWKKEELTDADYKEIVAIMNPVSLKGERPNLEQTFEASTWGAMIGFMRPDQRFHLMQTFMESPKKKDTVAMMDVLLTTGIISRFQAEELLRLPAAKGIDIPADFRSRLAEGHYEQEAEKYRKTLEDEIKKYYAGEYSRNLIDRAVGDGFTESPLLYMLGALWGAVTMGLNMFANLQIDKKDFSSVMSSLGSSVERMAKNPYVWGGAVALGVGVQGATGVLAGKGFMGGCFTGMFEGLSEKDQDELMNSHAHDVLATMYLNAPAEFSSYLDNGGFGTMLEVKKNKGKEGQKKIILLDDLIATEKDTQQKKRLESLKTLKYVDIDNINKKFNWVAEAAVVLHIESNGQFQQETGKIKEEQKYHRQEQVATPAKGTAVAQASNSAQATQPVTKIS